MRKPWVFLHFDGDDHSNLHPPHSDPLLPNASPLHLLSQLSSIFDSSLHHSHHLFLPASSAMRQALTHVSNLTASFIFWFSSLSHLPTHFPHHFHSHSTPPLKHISSTLPSCFFSHYFSTLAINHLLSRLDNLHSLSVLSLAASFIPPLHDLTSNMLSVPPEGANLQMLGSLDQRPCNVNHPASFGHSLPDSNWVRHTIEPRTGIEFPGVIDNILAKQNQSIVSSEVLVGTGSRTMTIIKIKSLKVYAFGFYIHPFAVCKKLGPKYAYVPIAELKERRDFYEDLLREDIGMTVRLVVNCNGMKINSVRDAFEKSLRARLLKTNPETDFKCISTFSSYFTKDIPLPAGTVIDFRRTTDGQLITEIGGNQIGAVQSKELCRAFFDMYIGEVPVSEETKEEIGRNVGGIIRRC